MGRIGFEGRYDYAAIGSVTNLASRLCSEAKPDQILVTQRVHGAAQDHVVSDALGELTLRGFSRPVSVFDIRGLDAARITSMTAGTLGTVALSDLDEAQRYAQFDRLQQRMPQVWERMRLNEAGESVVVVPSVTLDKVTERSGSMGQAMEERFLFLLLLLREPRLRMVYVTSMPIAPTIVEYYLALLPGIIPSHARARLSLVVGERLVVTWP